MDMIHRIGTNSRTLIAVLCLGGALGAGACTTSEANPDGGSGTGGSGGGGGTGTGGTTGSTETDGTLCPTPTAALITDFTYDATAADAKTTEIHFGDSTTLGGGEFVYPTSGTYAVTSDVTGSTWHISGNLGDYSGFGLYFDNCNRVDASAYKGIQFKISGSVPQGDLVTMGVGTLNNVIASSWLNDGHGGDGTVAPGRCLPTSGTNKYDQPTCADATKAIPVSATATTVSIMWSDFTGGKPEPGVTASDIISVYWFFPAPAGAGTTTPTPYMADITIDDLSFIP